MIISTHNLAIAKTYPREQMAPATPTEPKDTVDLNHSQPPENPPVTWAHRAVAGVYTAGTWGKTSAKVVGCAAMVAGGVLAVAAGHDILRGVGDLMNAFVGIAFHEQTAVAASSSWVAALPIAKTAMVLGGGLGLATGAGLARGLVRGDAIESRDQFMALRQKERRALAADLSAQAAQVEAQAKSLREQASELEAQRGSTPQS